MAAVIDSDQHLVEYRGFWREHLDPSLRDDAIELVDDAAGWTWITWRGERLGLAEAQTPGETGVIGERHQQALRGDACDIRFDDALPLDHWNPAARRDALAALGADEAMLFPNFGLLWERRLGADPMVQLAHMRAWNRWCVTVADEGQGRLHPVGHLHLRDAAWLDDELRSLAAAGVPRH